MDPKQSINIGDVVTLTDPFGVEHNALVTTVFDNMSGGGMPGVNVVIVSGDPANGDPYGRQTERATSVVHKSAQPAHGNYWDYK